MKKKKNEEKKHTQNINREARTSKWLFRVLIIILYFYGVQRTVEHWSTLIYSI